MQMIERTGFFINGRWAAPATDALLEVTSPVTEEVIARVPEGMPADIDSAVSAARAAFDTGPWPRMKPAERAAVMRKIAAHLRSRIEELTDTIVAEVGVPRAGVRANNEGVAALLEYYAQMAEGFGFEEVRKGLFSQVTVRHEPVGVVAAIVPWNGPMFLLMLKCAPALAAGCTIVAKPAVETPLCAYFLAEAAEAAGLPPGVLNIVAADRAAGEHLVRHKGIDKVSFTGSTAAGRAIASICGQDLKRVSLELGGKSAAIVLEDAPMDDVLKTVVSRGLAANNGQACLALTRVLLPKSRYKEFVDAITDTVKALKVGDPAAPGTQMGPLITAKQRERVERYIEIGKSQGGRVTVGGGRPADQKRGWFVQPTVFADVDNKMTIAQEEIFGPVGSLIPYETQADAIRIANDSPYGLGGAVFTANPHRAFEVARQIRTGIFGINGYALDFGAPFGGFKASGIDREMGKEGFEAFLETRTLYGVEPAG
jgi:betaine-aldehyde dehydrogenase